MAFDICGLHLWYPIPCSLHSEIAHVQKMSLWVVSWSLCRHLFSLNPRTLFFFFPFFFFPTVWPTSVPAAYMHQGWAMVRSQFALARDTPGLLKNCFTLRAQPCTCSPLAFDVYSQYLRKICMCAMGKILEKPRARHFGWLFEIPLFLLRFKIKQPVFMASAWLLNRKCG